MKPPRSTTHRLHTAEPLRRTTFNRIFAAVYAAAILLLLSRHALEIKSLLLPNLASGSRFAVIFAMLISDVVLIFMWCTEQAYRMRPIRRKEFPENLKEMVREDEFPALDVFICTADPYKEPPLDVANTALSVLAYDYPAEKLAVYVSDDGGSQLTLFAFMEAAKFAAHWLPYCKKNGVLDRNPEAYFAKLGHDSHPISSEEIKKLKTMYNNMKLRIDIALEKGKVDEEFIKGEREREAFAKWTDGFTRRNHPTVIQILLNNAEDKDISGHSMPNLIYLSREKSKASPHQFKAGAQNALLRVSATMTNAPIILTLDCDMYSNDPQTPLRILCYFLGPEAQSNVAYVHCPQMFNGINKTDIYACENKFIFQINPRGYDGLLGPSYNGSCCFIRRRAFFGAPSSLESLEIPEIGPDHIPNGPIHSKEVLALAHHVSSCNYENKTNWGSKIGVRYGSLVEDYFTSFRMHTQGWRTNFCYPKRAPFLGNAPISLIGLLTQCKRWCLGLIEVGFSKYSPIIYGTPKLGIVMALAYSYLGFWCTWSIPITIYAFLPQLALLNGVSIFPKGCRFPLIGEGPMGTLPIRCGVTETWFLLYLFLVLGAYAQEYLDFSLEGGTFIRWWNYQRMWLIKGVTCYLFALAEYLLNCLNISTQGFNVTSKVLEDEQSKRYNEGIFEFGVPSPMFVSLTTAALVNLVSFIVGVVQVVTDTGKFEDLFMQIVLSGFVTLNAWPIYEAMVFRSDSGRIPTKTTVVSALLTLAFYKSASLIFSH
ncbi:Cellulose synthase [Trema orientale]|uniref:Cellulose synthase n=1 Tax=Trema orientale TaxID=63057 RepID=A0A2P5FG51_TREOI|nr:Cellulose synthase [Trema orientale]